MRGIQIAAGNNNAAGYKEFLPQPAFDGIQYPREFTAADGTVYVDGAGFAKLTSRRMTAAQYDLILQSAGIATDVTRYALVTVRLPTRRRDLGREEYADYNAVLVNPMYGKNANWDQLYYTGIEFRLRKIRVI